MEVEGGVWVKGRHVRGVGFVRDMEKYNTAVLLGWRLIRVTPNDVMNGKCISMLRQLLSPPNANVQCGAGAAQSENQ